MKTISAAIYELFQTSKTPSELFRLLKPRVSRLVFISTRSIRSFDNLLFKFNVSLPLVTGELLQKTVAVNNVT